MEAISCQKNMWGAVVHIAKHVPSLFMSIAKGVSLDIKLERDIQKAKCKIKICCINNNLNSCADCLEYTHCPIVNEFYNKNGYKYRKYKQATEYIKQHGYKVFLKLQIRGKTHTVSIDHDTGISYRQLIRQMGRAASNTIR